MKTKSIFQFIISGSIFIFLSCLSNTAFGTCTLSTTSDSTSCYGSCDGTAYVTVTTGDPPYTFRWLDGSGQLIGQTNDTATGLCADTYIVELTDFAGNTCNQSVIVREPSDISFSLYGNDESCTGICDGSIGVSVVGGTSPYTYSWSNSANSQNVSSLCAGIYTLTVTDNAGCTKVGPSHTILADPEVYATSITNETCVGSCNGSIDLFVNSQWFKSYDWSWNNNQSSSTNEDLSNLCSDTYLVTVTTNQDQTYCSTEKSFVVTSNSPTMNLSLTATDATCGTVPPNGAASVTVSGGTSPFLYSWSNSATTSSISGLAPGQYTVQVTDDAGCTATGSVAVSNVSGPTVACSSTDATCGNPNGIATSTVTGGVSPYTYLWSNGAVTASINSLATGIYYLTVTDSNGCQDTSAATVSDAGVPSVATSVTDATCGNANGTATATCSGGTSPYIYLWNNGGNTSNITGLAPGQYTVQVTDDNNCTATNSVTVSNVSGPTITTSSVNATCGNPNGTATVTVSGGTSPYNYLWSNGPTTSSISGLAPGQYTVQVTDDNNCTATNSVTVSNVSGPTITTSSVNATCGNPNGTATVTVTGGVSPYIYNWDDPNSQTNNTATGLPAGSYTVTVTDINGCQATNTATVNDAGVPSVTTSVTDATCGNANGTATATVSGGTSPYAYDWDDPNGQTTAIATGLASGNFIVIVTDINSCEDTITATINDAGVPSVTTSVIDATCDSANGKASAVVTGGTSPYNYSWTSGGSSSTFAGIPAGTYVVTVTDSNGCQDTSAATVSDAGVPSVATSVTDATCGNANGTATATCSGGTSPYIYLWNNGGNTSNITGLSAGTYTVTVTDSNSCQDTVTATINDPGGPSVTASATDATCGNANGTATATASGGTTPYSYVWSIGFSTTSISGLAVGTYTITVFDNNNCSDSATVNITDPFGAPAVMITTEDITCYGDADGRAEAHIAQSTVPPYTFDWNNGGNSYLITGLATDTYIVTVTDGWGCTATDTAYIGSPAQLAVTYDITDPSCFGDCDGKIEANIIGGIPPYLLNGQSNTIVSGVCAGNYPVVVKDSNNCTFYSMASVNDPPMMEFTIDVTDASCGESDGSAVISGITNSTPPYLYQWTSGSTDSIADSLGAGMYMVTVTDTSGCGNFGLAVVSDQDGPTITVNSVNDVTCHGNGDGAITIDVTGGITPYTYFWSNGAMVEDISNLTAGPYEITIYDANGCTASKSIPVFGPQPIQLTMTKVFPSCGQTNGMAAVSINEGTPPYSISWSTGDTTDTITGLVWGVYHVTVTDDNGCVRYGAAPLGEQGGTSVQVDSVMDVSCGGMGAISVTVNGGTPPFNFTWYKDSVIIDTVEDLQGVPIGTYDLIITDSNGCMGAANATISGIGTNPEPICIVTVDTITGTNVIVWEKNNTSNIASYNIYKESTMAGVYYLIDNVPYSDTSLYFDTVSNPKVRAWRYKISVIDSCGNESDHSEVHKTMHLTINLSITPNEYNLIWDHYEGIYVPTYVIERYHPSTDWDSLDSVPSNLTSYIDDASSLPDQNNIYYRIRVTNPSGCYPSKTKNYNSSKSNTSAISLGAILSATASSTDATQGNCDGTATASASGGSAPYTYLWNDPMAQTNITATGLCPGTFLVIVVDAFGDSISASAIVLEISALSLTASSTDADFGSSNGTATVTATGGTPPYTYLWDASAGFQTTPTAAGLFAGTYTVTVTESLGDNESIDVTVNELTAVAEKQDVNNVLIYPNPGLGVLVIELKQAQQKYGTLQIYNLVGKLVRSQTIHSQKTYIDLSNEGPGIYTLKLKASERMVIRKIIIE